MFEFTDLDGKSRLFLLQKQKESVEYWRQLHRLKGAFSAWADSTIRLMNDYKAAGGVSDLTKAIDQVAIKGEITLKKLHNQTERVNQYLKDIDARLGDGTRWYNAIEIQELYASIEGATNDHAD